MSITTTQIFNVRCTEYNLKTTTHKWYINYTNAKSEMVSVIGSKMKNGPTVSVFSEFYVPILV